MAPNSVFQSQENKKLQSEMGVIVDWLRQKNLKIYKWWGDEDEWSACLFNMGLPSFCYIMFAFWVPFLVQHYSQI